MPANKTKATRSSVARYIESRANPQQKADCRALMAMLRKLTGHKPQMWGPSIVGYGSYKYTYESGHSGEAPLTGFAIRGRDLVLYVMPGVDASKSLLPKLGKHSMGKSCLYFRELADLNRSVLEKIVRASLVELRRRHG